MSREIPVVRQVVSNSPEETRLAGSELASTFAVKGLVVALYGELGAGKTQFTKGFAHALGIDEDDLHSPTFALANEYDIELKGQQLRFNHLDCYRFEQPEELIGLGIEDYLFPQDGLTLIEWAERIEKYLPEQRVDVIIRSISETERQINITARRTR